MSIINDQNPEYDVGLMQKHLVGCLEDQMRGEVSKN